MEKLKKSNKIPKWKREEIKTTSEQVEFENQNNDLPCSQISNNSENQNNKSSNPLEIPSNQSFTRNLIEKLNEDQLLNVADNYVTTDESLLKFQKMNECKTSNPTENYDVKIKRKIEKIKNLYTNIQFIKNSSNY